MSVVSSLTNRMFFSIATLVVLTIGVAAYLVNRAVTAEAEGGLAIDLDKSGALVDDFLHERSARFLTEARLAGVLPTLTNALELEPADPPTVQGVARDIAELMSPDLFIVTDRTDRVLARVGPMAATTLASGAIVSARPHDREATWFAPFPGGILQVVAIPIRSASADLGTLFLGFRVDQATLEGIKALTNSEIALVSGTRVLAGTLGPTALGGLATFANQPGRFRVTLGADDYLGLARPLEPWAGAPVVLVLRSRTEALRFLVQLQRDVALAGVAFVLIATLVGYAVARTVTRPLRAVTATMRTMAATGNLAESPPAPSRWDDEDARLLSATFRQLTTALDRFQKEAAQRERLSSLGRLSTVIAHEVRNPLMIIKSTARTLRRHPSPEVVAVAADIDEEVVRLNRVVSDVLDFARPLRFDLAPVDLGALCRDAAQAARVNPDERAVPIDVSAPEGQIVTDAERLQSVIVNLLTNAQQALVTRDPGATGPPVRLRAARTATGWTLDVSDAGAGIAPGDLPKLFEPFYTTRRTGSGLGLALVRNIVEGLGGTVTVQSTEGVGTTVRVELPDRPVTAEVSA